MFNIIFNPPASKVNRKVANLTERKICIPIAYVSKNFSFCMSVSKALCPQLSQDWLFFWGGGGGESVKKVVYQKKILKLGPFAREYEICTQIGSTPSC